MRSLGFIRLTKALTLPESSRQSSFGGRLGCESVEVAKGLQEATTKRRVDGRRVVAGLQSTVALPLGISLGIHAHLVTP